MLRNAKMLRNVKVLTFVNLETEMKGNIMADKEHPKLKKEQEEQEAYEWFLDRISLPGKPRKLTPEEIDQLKRYGRI